MKFKIEIFNWNWKLKLKIEIENWNWKLKLKIEIENWNWKWNLEIDIEIKNRILKLKREIEIDQLIWIQFLSLRRWVPKTNGMLATYRDDWFSRSFFYNLLYLIFLYRIYRACFICWQERITYWISKKGEIAQKTLFPQKGKKWTPSS